MGSEVIILPIIFGAIFGMVYLYFSTRNKERMALIEKGADASIFVKGKSSNSIPIWKILLLNLALLLIAIGLAIFVGSFLRELGLDGEVAYPGSIFLIAGIGLLVGFNMSKKLTKAE